MTIAWSDSFSLSKKTFLYRKYSDTVTVGFIDTFPNPRGCHCNRRLLYYAVTRFLPKFQDHDWMRGAGEHFVAMAEFDFASGSDSEISFQAGDEIRYF